MSATVSQTTSQDSSLARVTGTLQLVSFCLGQEVFGLEITKVREIILISEITQVPQTPPCVKGLINLRSTVIPVVDLRIRFGLPAGDFTPDSRIMVVDMGGKMVGIIVDAVSEVLRVSHDEIAPPPPTVASLGREYLTGLVRLKDQLLILLDIDRVLDPSDLAAAEAAV